MKPPKHIYATDFRYVHSTKTDLAKTFRRIIREREALAKAQADADAEAVRKMVPIKRRST